MVLVADGLAAWLIGLLADWGSQEIDYAAARQREERAAVGGLGRGLADDQRGRGTMSQGSG